jgi:hypothetical protein
VQTESDEERLVDCVPVREPAFIVPHSMDLVAWGGRISPGSWPAESRLRPGLAAPQGRIET